MAILKTDALQWYEGMLLQPHHFQQNDLRLRELLSFHVSQISSFHWGVKHFKLDATQLVAGKLVLLELEAVMPDGLVVSTFAEEGEVIEADLTAVADRFAEGPVMTYLAVPQHVYGGGNATGQVPRWVSGGVRKVVDENTGDGEIDIAMMVPNVKIFVGDEPSSHFSCFPLFQIKFEDNTYKLTSFSPPILKVSRESSLGQFAHSICETVRAKIAYLVERINSQTKFESMRTLEDSVQALTAGLLPFEAALYAEVAHPFDLYTRLCALAGHVAGLNRQQVPPQFPTYNHHNIEKSFRYVLEFITTMLARVQENYYTVHLKKEGPRFHIDLLDEWMSSWPLTFGMRVPPGANAADIAAWIEDAIICTHSALDVAIENRVLGVRRTLIQSENALNVSSGQGVLLFQVQMDPRFIVAGETLYIVNDLQNRTHAPGDIILYVPRK